MALRDFSHEGKAKARAALARRSARSLIERLEDLFPLVLRDAGAAVANRHADFIAFNAYRHLWRFSAAMDRRIVQNVPE